MNKFTTHPGIDETGHDSVLLPFMKLNSFYPSEVPDGAGFYEALAGSLDFPPETEDLNPCEPEEGLLSAALDIGSEGVLPLRPPFPFIVQDALKVAPGSTASLLTETLPSITAEALRESNSDTWSSPLKLPSISAFTHCTLPWI